MIHQGFYFILLCHYISLINRLYLFRGTFIKEIAHFAHSIYSHVLVLTQHLNQQQHQNYEYLFNSASEAQQALTKILRLSFNEDYRNAEISLGFFLYIFSLNH